MSLTVHILGPGFGESIVISFPGSGDPQSRAWGVIDCHASNLRDPDSNPVLALLRHNGVSDLEFLCLTHPHADHYEGMSHLFANLNIKRFWTFGALDLRDVLAYLKRQVGRVDDSESSLEYERILEHVAVFKKTRSEYYSRLADSVELFPPYKERQGTTSSVRIWSLGPRSGLVSAYERRLGVWLRGHPVQPRPSRYSVCHNYVSVVILIEYGQTQLLFGGDALANAWDLIHKCERRQPLKSCVFVKVAHHGSLNSWHPDVWREIACTSTCYAVITPCQRTPNPPPHPELIERLRPFCHTIVLTGPRTADEGNPTVMAHLGRRQPLATGYPPPWCIFTFDESGRMDPPILPPTVRLLHP